MKNNFSRSNVNESTLNVSMPDMSSFDMSHSTTVTPQLGKIYPVNFEPLLPRDIVTGSLSAKLDLEKIATPSIGRIRLDSHTFAVSAHRINRDYKQFSEGMSGYQTLPSFKFWDLLGQYFSFVFGSDYTNIISIPWFNSDYETIAKAYEADVVNETNVFSAICLCVINSINIRYANINNTNPTGHGYSLDFLQSERDRLMRIFDVVHQEYINNQNVNLANTLCDILKSLFGEGSLFDYLGYPILTPYSKQSNAINFLQNQTSSETLSPLFDAFTAYSLSQFLSIYNINLLSGDVSLLSNDFNPLLDEMPLRAYYAVWYDYFRNFHVEKRTDILDPDMFSNTSLIHITNNASFLDVLQLITFRTRNFARDFLTTVQTEDIFRYVYNPIVESYSPGSIDSKDAEEVQENNTILNNIVSELIQGTYEAYFPSNLINSQSDPRQAGVHSFDVLKSDLQTMRRAGMLEKLLAREYFYPDTYAGKMLARYGIQPGDIDMLNSVYLSGSEQFIAGDQLKASMATSGTERGTRTLVAGVNTQDAFAFTAKDNFYLISLISLVPMVSYDAPNLHLLEVSTSDIPLPQFASDTRVGVSPADLLRGFGDQVQTIGYVPRYYGWRCHPDETHGRYLSDYRSYNFFRDWYNMNYGKLGVAVYEPDNHNFTLNPYSLRVALPLDAFIGLSPWDSIAFGKVDINCFITRALPAAVESI